MEQEYQPPVSAVIVITILAVIAMAQSWKDIERYGKTARGQLKRGGKSLYIVSAWATETQLVL
ncbi:MAG: transposase family protein [Treponema sp.]|jgi:hypothetical protein|nr:transposase family protein [Treponema sp.]